MNSIFPYCVILLLTILFSTQPTFGTSGSESEKPLLPGPGTPRKEHKIEMDEVVRHLHRSNQNKGLISFYHRHSGKFAVGVVVAALAFEGYSVFVARDLDVSCHECKESLEDAGEKLELLNNVTQLVWNLLKNCPAAAQKIGTVVFESIEECCSTNGSMV